MVPLQVQGARDLVEGPLWASREDGPRHSLRGFPGTALTRLLQLCRLSPFHICRNVPSARATPGTRVDSLSSPGRLCSSASTHLCGEAAQI